MCVHLLRKSTRYFGGFSFWLGFLGNWVAWAEILAEARILHPASINPVVYGILVPAPIVADRLLASRRSIAYQFGE